MILTDMTCVIETTNSRLSEDEQIALPLVFQLASAAERSACLDYVQTARSKVVGHLRNVVERYRFGGIAAANNYTIAALTDLRAEIELASATEDPADLMDLYPLTGIEPPEDTKNGSLLLRSIVSAMIEMHSGDARQVPLWLLTAEVLDNVPITQVFSSDIPCVTFVRSYCQDVELLGKAQADQRAHTIASAFATKHRVAPFQQRLTRQLFPPQIVRQAPSA